MWPLGHAAVAYLCYGLWRETRRRRPPAGFPVLAVLFASQVPDLIDKPLSWYFGVLPTGRSLGHSFLFLVPLAFVVVVLARRYDRSDLGIASAVGLFSHPIVDALPALWTDTDVAMLLWPLLAVEPYEEGVPSIAELLAGSMGEPYFLLEFVLAAVALVVWHRHGHPGLETIRTHVRQARPS